MVYQALIEYKGEPEILWISAFPGIRIRSEIPMPITPDSSPIMGGM